MTPRKAGLSALLYPLTINLRPGEGQWRAHTTGPSRDLNLVRASRATLSTVLCLSVSLAAAPQDPANRKLGKKEAGKPESGEEEPGRASWWEPAQLRGLRAGLSGGAVCPPCVWPEKGRRERGRGLCGL